MGDTDRPDSGGVSIGAHGDLSIAGDVVGRDKIVTQIRHIHQRALSAAEEASQARQIEAQILVEGVGAYAQMLQRRVVPTTVGGSHNPYKELVEYDLSDAQRFFGRDRAIAEALRCLDRGRLLILHAESGAGKTSLLQAGLMPRLLASGHLPVYIRPYDTDPVLKIKAVFTPDLAQTPGLARMPLRGYLQGISPVLGPDSTLVLMVDQFEEYFAVSGREAQVAFSRTLADCLDDPGLNARWVFALRGEFFSQLDRFRPAVRNPFENDYRLNRLKRAEAEDAIILPARQVGLALEPALVAALLDDLSDDGGDVQPPQLQLVCSALVGALESGQTTITSAHYVAEGRMAGLLGHYLDRVLRRLPLAEDRARAMRLLEALITSDRRRARRTREALETELGHGQANVTGLDSLLGRLVDSRLLRVNDDLTYELVHDYLVDRIEIDSGLQARKAAQELLDAEVRDSQVHHTLLSDDKLAIIAPRQGDLVMNDAARALVKRSQAALRRRQRLVWGGVGLVTALAVVGALSVISALTATQQRESALATLQVAQSGAERVFAVQRQLYAQNGLVAVGTGPQGLAFDGRRIWVADVFDNNVRPIDPETGEVGPAIAVGGGASALAFDGDRLWVANDLASTVQAVNVDTGQAEAPISVGTNPFALVFAGGRLWVANLGDGTVQVIDPATGVLSASVRIGQSPKALAFDGQRIWVALAVDDLVVAIDPDTMAVGTRIPVGHAPGALAFDGARLWVSNAGSGTVQAIDPDAGRAEDPIALTGGAGAVVFDGARLWVANTQGGTVQAIDPATNRISAPIPVGTKPSALVFDGLRLWVANLNDGTVQALDPIAGDANPAFRVGHEPAAVLFDGARLWVANTADNTVQVIDSTNGETLARVSVGQAPGALAFDGTRVWVSNRLDDTIQAISATTFEPEAPLPVGAAPVDLIVDSGRLWVLSRGLGVQDFDPDTGQPGEAISIDGTPSTFVFAGGRLWVGDALFSSLTVIDPATRQTPEQVWIGEAVTALATDGSRLWAAAVDGSLRSVDLATGAVGEPVAVGGLPTGLLFDGARLWVANWRANAVQVVDVGTGVVGAPIPLGIGPSALAFDGDRVWVVNRQSETVQSVTVR